ncbi:hypothetical protein ES703_82928 [subsurface metagenome]
MEPEEKTKQYRNSVAESFGSLSLGIFAVSLVSSAQWSSIVLIIFGIMFALCGIYIIFPRDLKQEWLLENAAAPRHMAIYKRIGWLIVLAMFGYSLTQTGITWLRVIGILFAILAYVVFYISLLRLKARKLPDA